MEMKALEGRLGKKKTQNKQGCIILKRLEETDHGHLHEKLTERDRTDCFCVNW